ncbi:hypothetical protein [Methylobacter svalbardensis]|uniref:hypothetical protein n=1 Tax=Methylobacter svalbardensis TaxID=3080016 RepID=UPI0030ECBD28
MTSMGDNAIVFKPDGLDRANAGSRYFCDSFYGHPYPTSGKNHATADACGCPSRPGHSIATQQGVAHMLSNDSTRCRKACIFTTQKDAS